MKYLLRLQFVSLLVLTAGCAPKSIDSYHTGENEEEIVRLLNAREYGKAVWLIESKNGPNPDDKKIAFLLGQAYLGKAGFEPLAVAAKVSEAQDFSSRDARELFPNCPSAALGSGNKADVPCLLKRVYLHVPEPDLEELTRARDLFRYAYPLPAEAPEWVNVLIGVVETASCVKRAGNVYLFARRLDEKVPPSDEELRWLVRQAKRSIHEAAEALARAEHSGNKISQLLTGNTNTVWFDTAKGAIRWADKTGLSPLFDLLRQNVVPPGDEARFGPTLDRIRALLDEQEKSVAEGV